MMSESDFLRTFGRSPLKLQLDQLTAALTGKPIETQIKQPGSKSVIRKATEQDPVDYSVRILRLHENSGIATMRVRRVLYRLPKQLALLTWKDAVQILEQVKAARSAAASGAGAAPPDSVPSAAASAATPVVATTVSPMLIEATPITPEPTDYSRPPDNPLMPSSAASAASASPASAASSPTPEPSAKPVDNPNSVWTKMAESKDVRMTEGSASAKVGDQSQAAAKSSGDFKLPEPQKPRTHADVQYVRLTRALANC